MFATWQTLSSSTQGQDAGLAAVMTSNFFSSGLLLDAQVLVLCQISQSSVSKCQMEIDKLYQGSLINVVKKSSGERLCKYYAKEEKKLL